MLAVFAFSTLTILTGLKFYYTLNFFFLILSIKHLLVTVSYCNRSAPGSTDSTWGKALSYLSSLIPFFYEPSTELIPPSIRLFCIVLIIIGQTFSTIAIYDLGKSFGVSAARRVAVEKGLYSYFRHPIYLGYIIAEFGMVLFNPYKNTILFLINNCLYYIRSKREEELLIRTQN